MPSKPDRAPKSRTAKAGTRPTYSYAEHMPPPTVQYITSPSELDDCLTNFKGPYGFDCEFKALPVHRPMALIQLSNAKTILLIQVSAFSAFPERLKAILEDRSVKKIGHYTESDDMKLRDDYGILAKGLINLMPLARQVDPDFLALHRPGRNVTLAQIVLLYLDRTLPKGPVRVGNWERNPLTKEQQEYAASDAYCAHEVYTRLMALRKKNGIRARPSEYTVNISPRASSTPPQPQTGSYSFARSKRGSPDLAFDAYALWYYGYTVEEILRTFLNMDSEVQHMHAFLGGGDSMVIFYIVTALQRDASLPFDPVALRTMVSADPPSWSSYRTFVEERFPVVEEITSRSAAQKPAQG
ncbi:ribonuclease H-like protein [Peniophora sp. CONT]|nr:ribonuclease H-like protein [Peniophora sp. CONT]